MGDRSGELPFSSSTETRNRGDFVAGSVRVNAAVKSPSFAVEDRLRALELLRRTFYGYTDANEGNRGSDKLQSCHRE
jgi:hypothetical protein